MIAFGNQKVIRELVGSNVIQGVVATNLKIDTTFHSSSWTYVLYNIKQVDSNLKIDTTFHSSPWTYVLYNIK